MKKFFLKVTQLDMSMKEQHSQLQYRLNNTEEQLRGTTQELSESLSQASISYSCYMWAIVWKRDVLAGHGIG